MWPPLNHWLKRLRSEPADAEETSGSKQTAAGTAGEEAAARFLRDRGLKVITRNWRNPRDEREEIDLVCRDGETLVFVEVKARAAWALVPGYYTVNRRKKKVLRRACAAYLRALHPPPAIFRFDVVEVSTHLAGRTPDMLHFENVPLFSKHFRP